MATKTARRPIVEPPREGGVAEVLGVTVDDFDGFDDGGSDD
jgi:hypothetical protein